MLMLKVSRPQMNIFLGRLQTSMTEDIHQSEIRPAFRYEGSRETVTKYVGRALHALKAGSNGNSPYELLHTVY